MTTASSHLSKELKQLIKSIGETKSKQEEDRIILNELSTLKSKLSEKNLTPKQIKEHLIRAMYIQMLGHSAPFAHIHAINLTQNKNLILKRIGYLMCSLFFDKNSDLLIMLVATIQKDLKDGDVHEIVICLTSLGNIMNPTIAESIMEHVIKLLNHTTDLVRKKAILVLQKIRNNMKVEIPEYKEKMKKALCDREPSVMAASLNLYLSEIFENPKKYRELAGSFVIILKQVVEHKLPKEFDYHRMPAPWIQIKFLKLLQVLCKGDQKTSEHCYTILEQVLRRAEETSNNISVAVTYQCVRTIASIYPNESLLLEAASVLSKFLEPKSTNNMKFLGIQALSMLYRTSPKLLDEHQLIIVDCLESKDETLKKQTLDLLFKMTTKDNVQIIVSKMLSTLHGSTDNHFRNDLVLKITQLAERCSPSHEWYLSTMQILFELGSEYLSDDILNNFLKLVIENYNDNESFGKDIIIKMIELMDKIVPTDFVIKAVTWIIGEIGSSYYENDGQKLQELFKIVIKCLDLDFEKQPTKVWVLDALMKLSSAPKFKNHSDVKILLEKYIKNKDIELYQRALESKRLAKYNSALRNSHQLQSRFRQNLPFLNQYIENARRNGAKQYNRMKMSQNIEQELRFAPYATKTVTTSFDNFLKEKKEEEQKKEVKDPNSYEAREFKPPTFTPSEPAREKKKFIAPEEKAKQKMAKGLFGTPAAQPGKGLFGTPAAQPAKATNTIKPSAPASKAQAKPASKPAEPKKVQTTDLI